MFHVTVSYHGLEQSARRIFHLETFAPGTVIKPKECMLAMKMPWEYMAICVQGNLLWLVLGHVSDAPARLAPKAPALARPGRPWLSQGLGQAKAATHGLAQATAFGGGNTYFEMISSEW
jgi:hypothetical protein